MEDEKTKLSEVVYKSLSVDKAEQQLLQSSNHSEKKSSKFLYASAIVVNLMVFTAATGFSWPSSAFQVFQSKDPNINPLGAPITATEESWIASLHQLGAATGPLLAGKLSDILGRKKTLLAISIPDIICLLAMCFATDIRIFYVGRFIMGSVLGVTFSVVPMYLAEISEVHNRGTVMSTMGAVMNMGVFYCIFLGPFFSLKVLTFLCAMPLCLFVIFFSLFIPETPVFLASVGKRAEALEVLQQLRGTVNVYQELQDISKTLENSKLEQKGSLDLLKDRVLRKALIISVGLVFALQFSGINPLLAFLETILHTAGSNISVHLSANLVGGIQVIGTCGTILFIEKLGRRLLFMLSTVGCAVSYVILTIYFYFKDVKHSDLGQLSWLPVALLFMFMLSFSIGLSNLPFTLMGEIFPHSVKAVGISMASCSNFIFSFVITIAFRMILDQSGLTLCFFLLSVFMGLIILFTYYMVPETKGKTELEIQEMLKQ